MFFVVAYDVADDGRRVAVARVLEGFGTRVQKSVFECYLTHRTLAELRQRLATIVDIGEDSLRYYRLCQDCLRQVDVLGGEPVAEEQRYFVV